MDNDYAPRILQKRREYAEVQRILKDRDIQFQTMYPARLKVKYDEGTKIYEIVEEATQDMAKRGHPVEIIRAPETLMEQLRQLTWQKGSRRVGGRASSTHCKLQGKTANLQKSSTTSKCRVRSETSLRLLETSRDRH